MICYKKISVFGIMLLICSTNLFAQGPGSLWEKTYGGTSEDCGYSVQETSDSGYIVAGYTMSFGQGGKDVYLIRTDTLGDTLWTKTYGGTEDEQGHSVQQTSDSGFIIAGWTRTFGQGGKDVYLIKTDTLGDTVWTKTYGGTGDEQGHSVQQTSDGGYIITGYTRSFGSGNSDVYLIRTDTLGNTLWTKTYGGTIADVGYSVEQTSDGGYIITGYTSGGFDVYLIRTDTLGDTLWTKTYGGSSTDIGYSVEQTSGGGYIITGYTWSFSSEYDIYLIKTDTIGDTLWTKTYGETEYERGHSVQQTSDGGYIIAGYTNSFGSAYDFYLVKTDTLGDTLWTKTYGGTENEQAHSIQQTSDTRYIIVGWTGSYGQGGKDVYLIKTARFILNSPNGEEGLAWYENYNIVWFCDKFKSIKHHFQLLFSSNGGISYSDTIAKDISQDSTTWTWSVPCIYCTTCRVKIQAFDSLNNLLAEDESNNNFSITPIHLASPNGGEVMHWYSTHYILWECEYASLTPTASYFRLLLSSNGGISYPDTIAKNISSDHSSWEWVIPDTIESSECRVKIQFYNSGMLFAEDESDNNFTIRLLAVEEKEDEQSPKWLRGLVVYPNPFTKALNIRCLGTTEKQTINLKIYDLSGRLVKDFSLPTTKSSHTQTIFWDGKNKHGKDLSSGVYFLRFEAGKYKVTKRILLVK